MLQVHIPALPVSGQLNVALSGEVTIPVSGGIITIPVSHLPPHLQVRHVSSLTSCYLVLVCVHNCTLCALHMHTLCRFVPQHILNTKQHSFAECGQTNLYHNALY